MSEWIYICIYFLWTDFYGNYSNIVLKWGGVFEISSTKLKIKKKNFSFFYNRGMSEIKEKNKEIKILCWFACAIWFLKINTEIMHLKCCKTLNMQYLKHKIFDLILLIPTINKITQILWLMQLNNVCQLLQSLQIQKHLEFNFYKKCIWFLKKKESFIHLVCSYSIVGTWMNQGNIWVISMFVFVWVLSYLEKMIDRNYLKK